MYEAGEASGDPSSVAAACRNGTGQEGANIESSKGVLQYVSAFVKVCQTILVNFKKGFLCFSDLPNHTCHTKLRGNTQLNHN